ncbi:MAG: hypothetical protein DRI22_01225 [Caldiserica bacterium]|nr:MAG: hypothetical protein DRI22_01225 [Caldisericota bacterium]
MRKILLFTIFHLLFANLNASGYPGDYLYTFGATTRGLNLGGAGVASVNDSGSFYWNPALISGNIYRECVFFYSPIIEGTVFQSFSFNWPICFRNVIGLSWVSLKTEDAEWVDSFGVGNRGTFSNSRDAFFITLGRRLSRNIDWGINLKIVNEKFFTWQDSGFGLDIGSVFFPEGKFSFGFMIQNILQPSLKFAPNALPDTYPLNLRVGFIWRQKQFSFSFDYLFFDLFPDEKVYTDKIKPKGTYFTGVKIRPLSVFSIFLGYNEREYSAGFLFSLGDFDFGYNWAVSNWGDNHRFSLGIRFGALPSLKEKVLKEKEKELKVYERYLENKEKDIIAKEKRQEEIKRIFIKERLKAAKRYLKNHEYSLSKREVRSVLRVDPENKEAQKILRGIKKGILKADLKYAIALQYYKNGEYKKSIKYLKKAIRMNPEDIRSKYLLNLCYSRIFLKKGQYKEARKYAIEAFKLKSESEEPVGIIKGIDEILKGRK